ncbi:BrnA antitoxin family protein [Terrihabitans sp. B22-R8]|uniref:BrnA antitoxin family protein n=1 Tax=Terrihabitans sp. B22-R8 TaxID=3425128 RepID=UPI00403CDFCB
MAFNSRNRPGGDARQTAEAAFKKATTKPAEGPVAAPALPGAREMVSLRLDRDVLEHFQQDGPGWQDRINAALRKAADLA